MKYVAIALLLVIPALADWRWEGREEARQAMAEARRARSEARREVAQAKRDIRREMESASREWREEARRARIVDPRRAGTLPDELRLAPPRSHHSSHSP